MCQDLKVSHQPVGTTFRVSIKRSIQIPYAPAATAVADLAAIFFVTDFLDGFELIFRIARFCSAVSTRPLVEFTVLDFLAAARFTAHRLFIAAASFRLPSAVICPLPPEFGEADRTGLPGAVVASVISRNTSIARSMEAFCCSS